MVVNRPKFLSGCISYNKEPCRNPGLFNQRPCERQKSARVCAIVVQHKTKRPAQFELLDHAQGSLRAWLKCRGGAVTDYVVPSRIDHAKHISTRQYARLVEEWVDGIGLRREHYGTHSLRRTKAAMIDKQTGNLRAVRILLGHTKIESTIRHLGVDVKDAPTLAERAEI